MFSSPINSIDILNHLARGNNRQETARLAPLFELMLQQSRFGWLSGGESSSAPGAMGSQDWMGQQQAILNHMAARVPPVKTSPALSPPGDVKPETLLEEKVNAPADSVPRSIPLLAKQAAEKHGIPSKLFRRLIWVESEFNPKAVSPMGAMGLGQLMPETARELGLSLNAEKGVGAVWDPESNLDAAARYLKWLHGTFTGKGIGDREAWRFSAAAYNAGIGNISKAMDRVTQGEPMEWDRVAAHLPRVTGRASEETLNYLARLRL